jgi:hypothetical protein
MKQRDASGEHQQPAIGEQRNEFGPPGLRRLSRQRYSFGVAAGTIDTWLGHR